MSVVRTRMMQFIVCLLLGLGVVAYLSIRPTEPLPVIQETSEKMLQIEVRKGFCLSSIANDLGTDWKRAALINGLDNPNEIFPGQKIIMPVFDETDIVKVSWYGPGFHGKKMANGETYNMDDSTVAAHKWLPFGTKLRLRRIDNDKSVDVVIQDRGPYVAGRIFDLSRGAAKKLDMIDDGIATCQVEILD